MNTTDIRKELHDYIETADVSILNVIYEILHASDKTRGEYEISDELKQLLDNRLKAYHSNPKDVLTLEEMKAKYKKL